MGKVNTRPHEGREGKQPAPVHELMRPAAITLDYGQQRGRLLRWDRREGVPLQRRQPPDAHVQLLHAIQFLRLCYQTFQPQS